MIRLIDERVMEKLRDKPENIDLEEFVPLVGEWREDKASKAKCLLLLAMHSSKPIIDIMRCPIDQIELEKKNYESLVEIDECPKCSGIWLDQGELEKIQDIQENDYSEDLKKVPNEMIAAYEQARQQNAADIICPNCKVEMFKKEGYGTQIVIDKCPKCFGVWLNKGELKALEVFFDRNLEESILQQEEFEKEFGEASNGFWAKFSKIFGK